MHAENETHNNLDAYASFWMGGAGGNAPPPIFFISKYSFFLAIDLNNGTKIGVRVGKGVMNITDWFKSILRIGSNQYYVLVQINIKDWFKSILHRSLNLLLRKNS